MPRVFFDVQLPCRPPRAWYLAHLTVFSRTSQLEMWLLQAEGELTNIVGFKSILCIEGHTGCVLQNQTPLLTPDPSIWHVSSACSCCGLPTVRNVAQLALRHVLTVASRQPAGGV